MSDHAVGTGAKPDSASETARMARDRVLQEDTGQGWITFAAVMLLLTGVFNVIVAIAALLRDAVLVITPTGTLLFDLTMWGWIHLIGGGLQVIVGAALFTRAMWALVTAIVLAGLNAVAQLVFLPYSPVWSTIVIALDVLVIWAVVVHGIRARDRTA
jgi:hypothetical protein